MMKQATQAPNLTHANAASICHMALKTMGLQARKMTDYREGYDFLVEDKVRIAVRYAIPTSDREQVYRKRNGELSHYSYKRWTFNFHRHGKRPEQYCDFFVCFLGSPGPSNRRAADDASAVEGAVLPQSGNGADTSANGATSGESTSVTVFVIPWEAITGLTFCSSMREGSTRPYRGKYAIYRDGWNLIGDRGLEGREAPLGERKRLRISADSRRRLQLVVGPAVGTDEGSSPGLERPSSGPPSAEPGSRVSSEGAASSSSVPASKSGQTRAVPHLRLHID
jgi:hypothetical protein